MNNVYYSPEKFGLRTIDEVEFSSGSYEFDTSVLWQDNETGALYVADDAGCSCPSPFESIGRGDLTRIDKLQQLIDYLDERKKNSYNYDPEWGVGTNNDRIDADCASMIQKYREAVA